LLGYNPNFLGEKFKIDIPSMNHELTNDILKNDQLRNGYIADYQHYSVVMSKLNRQAYISICNLDLDKFKNVKGKRWFLDSRIGFENQLDNRYYKKNVYDRGHLTRRTAVTWGDTEYIAKKASNDSCCYSNSSLQHENFNQDEWRIPELIASRFKRAKNNKISIMTGPIFTEDDRWLIPNYNVTPGRIPSGFWKIIYYVDIKKSKTEEIMGCEAYLVSQDEKSIIDKRGSKKIDIKTLQVSTTELIELTGIYFPEPLYNANSLYYYTENRNISEPERYEIKVANKSNDVKKDWEGHVIHERDDIKKHNFIRVSS
jgi:endonuclease G